MSSDFDTPAHTQPLEASLSKLFFMSLRKKGDEYWPPWDVESVWAKKTGPDEYILLNSPFFAKNVSYRDVVATTLVDGAIAFQGVVKRSGYSTYRLIIKDAAQTDAVLKLLDRKGVSFEGMGAVMPLYSVSIEPTADTSELFDRLDQLNNQDVLDLEEGYFFDGEYELTPSGWEVT